MKASDQKLVRRFVDCELEGAELAAFETRLENESDLREAVESEAGDFSGSEIGEGLREVFAGGDVVGHDMRMAATSLADVEIPNPDFFNSRVLDRLQEETGTDVTSARRGAQKPNPRRQGFFDMFGLGWAVAGIAATALVAVLVMRPGTGTMQTTGSGHTTASALYAPNPGTVASGYYSEEAGAMVIALEGLQAIPADTEVVGLHLKSYEPAEDLASHTLYSTDGAPVLAMATDLEQRPVFRRISTGGHGS